MSSQTTLSESIDRAGEMDYRVEETRVDLSSSVSEPHNQCLGDGCGRDLSAYTARVLGDNDGNIPQCEQCTDYKRVVKAVTYALKDEGERRG